MSYGNSPGYYKEGNILLPKNKAIYFFIPKVACTSIKKVIADSLDYKIKNINDPQSIHLIHFPYEKRNEIKKGDDFFKFAFVRNPWGRILSSYKQKISDNSNVNNREFKDGVFKPWKQMYGAKFWAGMSFKEFVNEVFLISDEFAESHFRSQHTFLTDSKGELLPDFIGKFENLQEDFNIVCKEIGTKVVTLPMLTTSDHKHYNEYYDEDTKSLIRSRYKKDIELFGYEFEDE